MDIPQSHANTLAPVSVNQSLTARRPAAKPERVERSWKEKVKKEQGARGSGELGREKVRGKADETTDPRQAASQLRRLADDLDAFAGGAASSQTDRQLQALLAGMLEALVRRRLKSCKPGDWRAAFEVLMEGARTLDDRLADVLVEHVNGPRFLGERREIPPVEDRREFVQTLNSLLERFSIRVVPPHSDQHFVDHAFFSVSGRHSAIGVVSRQTSGHSYATTYLAGVGGRESLPPLEFVSRTLPARGR